MVMPDRLGQGGESAVPGRAPGGHRAGTGRAPAAWPERRRGRGGNLGWLRRVVHGPARGPGGASLVGDEAGHRGPCRLVHRGVDDHPGAWGASTASELVVMTRRSWSGCRKILR